MSFEKLYDFSAALRQYPIQIEGVLDRKAMSLSAQDELYYVPVDLDERVSLGHIKQYRVASTPYDADPAWVTEIRYSKDLNFCWRRYVCCKELMHVFDSQEERADSGVKFKKLLNELESPLPSDKESPMYRSENKTMWMALFVLCPRPLREHFKLLWDSKALSTYGVALELRIPEDLVATIMSDSYGYVLDSLIGQNKP